MEHSFALTDEKINTFKMTLGNEAFRAPHPGFAFITACKDYRNSLRIIDIEMNHIAFIDSQMKIIPRRELFIILSNESYFS